MPEDRPNVLFVMTDQQRADTIAALGNDTIHTPNFDRLVERGIMCTNACPSVRSACRRGTTTEPAGRCRRRAVTPTEVR